MAHTALRELVTHHATAKILENWRRRRLQVTIEDVSCVDLAVELTKLEMTSCASLVNEMNTCVDVLSTFTATDGPARLEPSHHALHVRGSLSAKTGVGAVW
jgi:hypothetical protein